MGLIIPVGIYKIFKCTWDFIFFCIFSSSSRCTITRDFVGLSSNSLCFLTFPLSGLFPYFWLPDDESAYIFLGNPQLLVLFSVGSSALSNSPFRGEFSRTISIWVSQWTQKDIRLPFQIRIYVWLYKPSLKMDSRDYLNTWNNLTLIPPHFSLKVLPHADSGHTQRNGRSRQPLVCLVSVACRPLFVVIRAYGSSSFLPKIVQGKK